MEKNNRREAEASHKFSTPPSQGSETPEGDVSIVQEQIREIVYNIKKRQNARQAGIGSARTISTNIRGVINMGILLLDIMLLLFGFVTFLVLGFVVGFVYLVCKVLGCVVYSVCKTFFNALFLIRKNMHVLKSIPDLDLTLVDKSDVVSHLIYNNKLLHLYKGPDKNGCLYIPEGVESIDKCAFDDFLMYDTEKDTVRFQEGISAIVLPSTIKELNIDNIPEETALAFTDARSKSILRGIEDNLEYREIEVKGGLFSDVLKECETLEHIKDDDEDYDDEFPEVPNMLALGEIGRINDAFSKIADPSLKIELMDRFHALVLSGDMSIPDFEYLLMYVNFKPKDRYYGKDVIERIYGSVEDAYARFETKYYESENIRRREATAERTQTCAQEEGPTWICAKNVFKTIEFVESVAKDPTAFSVSNGDQSEVQDNDVSRQDQN